MAVVSIKDVALRAHVSIGTVSNVINSPTKVAAATIARVRSAIDELSFTPNEAARQLRLGKPDTIGLVVADGSNPFYRELASGVQTAALDHGLLLVTVDIAEPRQARAAMLTLANHNRTRGLIVTCDLPVDWLSDELESVHVVHLDQVKTSASSVSVDNAVGGRMAVEHLIGIGRRHIVFLGSPLIGRQVADRWRGAASAAKVDPTVIIEQLPIAATTVTAGRRAAEDLLQRPSRSRPDAIFAANDLVAMGVLQAFNGSQDYSIPHDVSLVGYDDTEYAAAAVVPLTSLRQPTPSMASTAVEILVEETTGTPFAAEFRAVVFEPTLMQRESSRIEGSRIDGTRL